MKYLIKIAFVIVFIGFSQNSMAQIRVLADFNSVFSGRSINVLASGQVKNRHEFGGGLRININKFAHNDDQGNTFKKRMFATKPVHYFGLNGFYQIHLFQKLKHIDFFAFYDVQVSYSTTQNRIFWPAAVAQNIDSSGVISNRDGLLYELHKTRFGPFVWLEQNIGIGFTVDIWKNIFFTQRLGAGTCFILGRDPLPTDARPYTLAKKRFKNSFGYLFSVGVGYRFN